MAEVEELLDEVAVRMPTAAQVRVRGRRRTLRRRAALGVAVTAVVAGGAVWVGAPGGGAGREVRPAASPTANPFKVGGMVRALPPEEMPEAGKWHWKGDEEQDEPDLALPAVGEPDSCPGSYALRKVPNQVQYATSYYSDKGATARQRVTEYDSENAAGGEVARLRGVLAECGLRDHGTGVEHWSGETKSSSWLRVDVKRWGKWVSVVEVEAEESAR
ncbi:hypothetical protein OG302_15860 [Streptomyces sp. NBC_01283]|uniref:hypothetical protein n=1 Tax=Streptomyces sp. NBC_01283 TaxID=2903812 RepID=UPI00352BFD2F|nr:hypothetical protein OG302_15860 [Streptomyces sp. NBC_01283]